MSREKIQEGEPGPESFDEGEMTFSGGAAVYAVVVTLGVVVYLACRWVWWAVGV
jgi:hypothetical protein